MAEAAGELPAKTGAPLRFKVKQLELDGMHSTDTFTFGFVVVGFIFNSLCYIILLYFCSVLLLIFSDPLNVFSLEMVCTVVREDLGRESSCNAKKAGRLYLVALCDCPSLCSQRPLYVVTFLRGVYLRNLGCHTDLSLWVWLGGFGMLM